MPIDLVSTDEHGWILKAVAKETTGCERSGRVNQIIAGATTTIE